MRSAFPSPIEVAVVAYCAFQAADLPASWLHAPAARYAWIAFLIWLAPVVWTIVHCVKHQEEKGYSLALLGLALAVSLAGTLGSLNVLKHIGLALAIAGMLPFRLDSIVWIITCVAWLPASGYALKAIPFSLIPLVQICVTTVGSVFFVLRNRRSS